MMRHDAVEVDGQAVAGLSCTVHEVHSLITRGKWKTLNDKQQRRTLV